MSVPNGAMANGNIINYTAEGKMRVDTSVGVDYGSDIKKTKEVLLAIVESKSASIAISCTICKCRETGR